MHIKPHERDFSLSQALSRVQADLDSLGWRHRLNELALGGGYTAIQCHLETGDGEAVESGAGSGKGFSDAAKVGAVYEALEHALTGSLILPELDVMMRGVGELRARGDAAPEKSFEKLAPQHEARIACLRYRALDGGHGADLPLYLWAPWYVLPTREAEGRRCLLGDTVDYRSVLPASVNSGCAVGATEDEALLHAVNELIERDALSLFLWRSIHNELPMPPRISLSALPRYLAHEVLRAEELLGRNVYLLDLTTDIGVPVALAFVPGEDGHLALHGVGASLSPRVAVERAVSELVQVCLVRRVHPDAVDGTKAAARLAAHPRLLKCAQIRGGQRLESVAPVRELPDEPRNSLPASEQLEEVVSRVSWAGIRVFAHRIKRLPNGTSVVNVQCPGLDKFHLILQGNYASPGPRAKTDGMR
ncbi:YcaO-like family protein [Streptomyces lavendulae]|uniref:YcaO-like family protein n=1 Tax=Streptomyces lavendulae TaxID=1914 RepID=UPI0036BF4970